MSYKLSPTVGKAISKETANRWIKNYHEKNSEQDGIRARFFGLNIIDEILSQHECVGIRIYYACNDEGEKQLLLVGAREDGSNIWPDDTEQTTVQAAGLIVDASSPCPPYCPSN